MSEDWDDGLISDRTDHNLEVCYCIGPQDGEPLCPCGMRRAREALGKLDHMTYYPLLGEWRPKDKREEYCSCDRSCVVTGRCTCGCKKCEGSTQ